MKTLSIWPAEGCVKRIISYSTQSSVLEDGTEDEPDMKKLRLGKRCSVEDLECTLCCRYIVQISRHNHTNKSMIFAHSEKN